MTPARALYKLAPMNGVPLWVRGLVTSSKAIDFLKIGQAMLRDDLLYAYLTPDERAEITQRLYDADSSYFPGGKVADGLHAFEEEALAQPGMPRAGRVLIGGAGAGRETRALVSRGFSVFAFEPAELFHSELEKTARASGGKVQAARAAYADLIEAADGRGALAAARSLDFSLVITGWGSLLHLPERETQDALMRAIRSLAPEAPVLLSVNVRGPWSAPKTRWDPVRARWAAAIERLGGRHRPDGAYFDAMCGFAYSYTEDDVVRLARVGGYRVERLETTWQLFYPEAR
ncbi:MAG: class I SAM-dependent methyltransferase [Polyangiaceae bacterium]|nr:class I SAM-dependent methyltransferase [Polyangiaceae bacterium]